MSDTNEDALVDWDALATEAFHVADALIASGNPSAEAILHIEKLQGMIRGHAAHSSAKGEGG